MLSASRASGSRSRRGSRRFLESTPTDRRSFPRRTALALSSPSSGRGRLWGTSVLKKMLMGAAAIGALLLGPPDARAALVDLGLFTRDTSTNLDWLDTTEAQGLTYSAIQSGAGGFSAAGWRFATRPEVDHLFSSQIDSVEEDGIYGDARFEKTLALILRLGVNVSVNDPRGVVVVNDPSEQTAVVMQAWFNDLTADAKVGVGYLHARYSLPGDPAKWSRWATFEDFLAPDSMPVSGRGQPLLGALLVREVSDAVPTPGVAVLMLTAVVALAVTRRRPFTTASRR
jgi:hypothetical protein